jgi:hypothetical protein
MTAKAAAATLAKVDFFCMISSPQNNQPFAEKGPDIAAKSTCSAIQRTVASSMLGRVLIDTNPEIAPTNPRIL